MAANPPPYSKMEEENMAGFATGYDQQPQPKYAQSPAAGYPAPPTGAGYAPPPAAGYPAPPPGAGYAPPPAAGYPAPPPGAGYAPPPGAGYGPPQPYPPPMAPAMAQQSSSTNVVVVQGGGTSNTVVVREKGINHCLHCCISIFFPPWIIVWICLCICD